MTRHEQLRDFTKSLYIYSRTHCVMWLWWRFWGVQSEKGSWTWALAASILRHWTWTALNPWDRTLHVLFASQVSGFYLIYLILLVLNRIIPECQGSKWKEKEWTNMQTKAQKASYESRCRHIEIVLGLIYISCEDRSFFFGHVCSSVVSLCCERYKYVAEIGPHTIQGWHFFTSSL